MITQLAYGINVCVWNNLNSHCWATFLHPGQIDPQAAEPSCCKTQWGIRAIALRLAYIPISVYMVCIIDNNIFYMYTCWKEPPKLLSPVALALAGQCLCVGWSGYPCDLASEPDSSFHMPLQDLVNPAPCSPTNALVMYGFPVHLNDLNQTCKRVLTKKSIKSVDLYQTHEESVSKHHGFSWTIQAQTALQVRPVIRTKQSGALR